MSILQQISNLQHVVHRLPFTTPLLCVCEMVAQTELEDRAPSDRSQGEKGQGCAITLSHGVCPVAFMVRSFTF